MYGSGFAAKPDYSSDDDEDALDKGRNGVSNRGDHGEQHEGNNVLAEVKNAVEDELQSQSAVIERRGLVHEIDGAVGVEVAEEAEAFGPEPKGKGKEEGKAGAVAEQIELVEFALRGNVVGFRASSFVEEFFGEYVLGDENDGGDKGAEDTWEVAGEFDGASEDDAKGKGDEREVSGV